MCAAPVGGAGRRRARGSRRLRYETAVSGSFVVCFFLEERMWLCEAEADR